MSREALDGVQALARDLQLSRRIEAVIHPRITNELGKGVHIAGRHYDFLAWSSSQLRDHGCYLYAPVLLIPALVEGAVSQEQEKGDAAADTTLKTYTVTF